MDYYKLILILGMVVTGSINTIVLKLQVFMKAEGKDGGEEHHFEHPWVQTLTMFMGEIICLVYFGIGLVWDKCTQDERKRQMLQQPLLNEKEGGEETTTENPPAKVKFNPFVIAAPAVCDLMGTTLSGFGLLYVPASVWQMLRGSIIVFTGIFSLVFLKRKLYAFHYLGMAVVTSGLVLVGLSSTLSGGGGNSVDFKLLGGIGLVLLGMVMNAIQFVVEETFLQGRKYPPLQVVGWEGIWGSLGVAFVALPVFGYLFPYLAGGHDKGICSDNSPVCENVEDALYMAKNNYLIIVFGVTAMFSISAYNFFGLSVTAHVSSLARAVLDSLRTIVIWIVMLGLYVWTDSAKKAESDRIGEVWNNYSFVQVGGFLLLVLGNMIYGQAIKIPGLHYPEGPTA